MECGDAVCPCWGREHCDLRGVCAVAGVGSMVTSVSADCARDARGASVDAGSQLRPECPSGC
jgi:hypothetical protein